MLHHVLYKGEFVIKFLLILNNLKKSLAFLCWFCYNKSVWDYLCAIEK